MNTIIERKNTINIVQTKKSVTAKCGKIKIVLVTPNSDVEIIKEIISKENNSFIGDIPISYQKGINTIKIVGSNYSSKFEISQNQNMLFEYSNNQTGDDLPFGKEGVTRHES